MIATSKEIRFSVQEYFRMSDAGVFDRRRVELIDGRVLQMHAQANTHRAAIALMNIVLNRHFGDPRKFWLVVQGTMLIPPKSAPEPDFHVSDVPVGTPDSRLPRPFLVIEVADRSYRRDATMKLRTYAAAGIADYWIENLNEQRIEVYRDPFNPTGRKSHWQYRDVQHYRRGQRIGLLRYPDISVAVDDLLPQ